MDLTILKNIGLTDGEIKIYEVLLEVGELPANEIIARSGLKKGDCYNKVYELKDRGFIEEYTKDKKKHFRLAHPNIIKEYIDNKLQEISKTEREINTIIPSILSTYNLSYNKPGVQFFEGEDAIRKVMEDIINTGKEALSFVDIKSFSGVYDNLNEKFLKKRYKAKIYKKNLLPKTEPSYIYEKKHKSEFTETRFMNLDQGFEGISVNIYGDKISLMTRRNDALISIIINDPTIAAFMRALYQIIWNQSEAE